MLQILKGITHYLNHRLEKLSGWLCLGGQNLRGQGSLVEVHCLTCECLLPVCMVWEAKWQDIGGGVDNLVPTSTQFPTPLPPA